MLQISVKNFEFQVAAVMSQMDSLQKKQVPFAISLTLNKVVSYTKSYMKSQMQSHMDSPINFTLNSLTILKSDVGSKSKGRAAKMTAELFFKEHASKGVAAVKYLQAITYGGARATKGSERALQRRGIIRQNEYLIPTKTFRDAHGNIKAGAVIAMMSALNAHGQQGYTANANARSVRGRSGASRSYGMYFVKDNTIYKRVGARAKSGMRLPRGYVPFMHIVKDVRYNVQFPFDKLSSEYALSIFEVQFAFAMKRALDTMRKR